jgi:hypothetical protein
VLEFIDKFSHIPRGLRQNATEFYLSTYGKLYSLYVLNRKFCRKVSREYRIRSGHEHEFDDPHRYPGASALVFHSFSTERATLATGDYSCICDGWGLSRLAAIRFRALAVGASRRELGAGMRVPRLTSRQVLGSGLAWTFKYSIALVFAGHRSGAAIVIQSLLSHAARYAQPERKYHERTV